MCKMTRTDNSPKLFTKRFDVIFYILTQSLIVLGVIFQLFTQLWTENTIFGMRLFWISMALGVFTSFILIFLLKWISPSVYLNEKRRLSVYLGLFLGFAIFTPALAAFINHKFSESSVVCRVYQVESKSKGSKGNRTNYIEINIENKMEQFIIDRDVYDNIETKGQIELCTRKGILGYEFVTEFKAVN